MSEETTHHLGEDLWAFVEGGLDDARAAELGEHVRTCGACQQAVAETKQVFAALDTPPVEPSAAFDRALFGKLDELDRAAQPSLLSRLKAWLQPPQLIAAGAMAAAVVVAAVMWTPPSTQAPAQSGLTLLASKDAIDVAENLELLEDLELYEQLDALEDIDAIELIELEAG